MIEAILNELPYIFSLFFVVFFISKSKSLKTTKKLLFFYLIALFAIAFVFIPNEDQDLYRLTILSERYAQKTIPEIFELASSNNAPMSIIYMALIGKTGIPGLLPAITTFITFGCVFTVIYKAAKKYNLQNRSIAKILFFTMAAGYFLMVISNIRTLMALAIISLCIYTEVFENRKIIHHILPYLFASLLHPAAIIVTLIRFTSYLLIEKKISIRTKFIASILLSAVLVYLSINSTIISSALEKAGSYLSKNTYSQKWEYIISGLYITYYIFTYLLYRKEINDNPDTKALSSIVAIYTIVSIACVSEYAIFTRFQEVLLSTLFIPLLSYVFVIQKNDNNTKRTKKFNLLFMLFCIIIITIVCLRGNLSHYRFM